MIFSVSLYRNLNKYLNMHQSIWKNVVKFTSFTFPFSPNFDNTSVQTSLLNEHIIIYRLSAAYFHNSTVHNYPETLCHRGPKSSCCWTISEDGYSKLIFKNVYYIYSLRVFVWWCDIFSFAIFIGVNSSIFMLNVVPMIFNSHRIWFHVLGYSIESTLILMRRSWRKFTNYIKLLKLNFASRTRFKGQPLIFTLWFFCSLCFLGWLEAFSPQLVNSNMPLDPSTSDRISLNIGLKCTPKHDLLLGVVYSFKVKMLVWYGMVQSLWSDLTTDIREGHKTPFSEYSITINQKVDVDVDVAILYRVGIQPCCSWRSESIEDLKFFQKQTIGQKKSSSEKVMTVWYFGAWYYPLKSHNTAYNISTMCM